MELYIMQALQLGLSLRHANGECDSIAMCAEIVWR